jgi:hypothetical protein
MSGFDDFKETLAIALGSEKAEASINEARADGAPVGDSNPKQEIEVQAREIAIAIKKYLIFLSGDTDNVRKPFETAPMSYTTDSTD